MSSRRRWAVVAAGLALLVGVPALVLARPVPAQPAGAAELLARVQASRDVPLVGLAESRGAVALPEQEALSAVARLLGRTNRVRVWWSGPEEWRTALLRTTGETDHVHRGDLTLRWVYESRRVTLSPEPPVRLPLPVDLLPHVLADRLLDGARPGELSRIGERRVAGRDTAGLRLTPSDPRSTVGHVDVWVDAGTGVPLQVDVLPADGGPLTLSTAYLDVGFEEPDPLLLTFAPPTDASLHYDETLDVAAAAERYAGRTVPETLAGLPGRLDLVRSVGVYGRGPLLLLALPVREDDARGLRDRVSRRPGAVCSPAGWQVGSGALQLLVTAPDGVGHSWLLAGTVTPATLAQARADLSVAGTRRQPCP